MQRRDFIKSGIGSLTAFGSLLAAGRAERRPESPSLQTRDVSNVLVKVLGTAQDGGFPGFGCYCPNCLKARENPSLARLRACLALCDMKNRKTFFVDATPDIASQFDIIHNRMGYAPKERTSVLTSILLTHADLGNYTGLLFYGYEGLNATRVPVYCTPTFSRFMEDNYPWSDLIQYENVLLNLIHPEEKISLTPRMFITPLLVPSRDEYSDTLGMVIQGESKKLLYIPEIESWEGLERSIEEEVESADFAILDGTYFSQEELRSSGLKKIGHPFMTETMKLLGPVAESGKTEIYFSHLNHTNAALDPEGSALKEIKQRGFDLASEGMEITL